MNIAFSFTQFALLLVTVALVAVPLLVWYGFRHLQSPENDEPTPMAAALRKLSHRG